MAKKKLSKNAVAVIIALIVIGVVFGSQYLQPSGKMSLFSVSQVEINPQGGQVIGDKLKGCYWVVMVSVDQLDDYAGKVEIITEGKTQGEFDGKTVEAQKSLEISINPEQAFFYRGIEQEEGVYITEDAYKTVRNFYTSQVTWDTSEHRTPLVSNHYVWAEDFWKAETTFKVQAWLNDVRITPLGGKVMNTHAGETDFTFETSYGQVTFRSLGGLTGGWEEPDVGPLLMWNENYIYDYEPAISSIRYDSGGTLVDWREQAQYDTKVQKLINHDNPYSVYWFGNMRWSEKPGVTNDEVKGTPVGVRPELLNLVAIDVEDYGGWTAKDDSLFERRLPVKPVIFPEQKNTLPSGKQDFYSVTEYLQYVKALSNKGRLGSQTNQVFRGYDSWKLDSDNKQVRVYMPFNAYETPVIQILVPVELVDTWVWEPAVANLKITGVGWVGGTSTGMELAAGITRTCWVKVRQDSTVESTGKVLASASTPSASINPTYKTPTLAPGEEATLYFEVTNLGVSAIETGRVQIQCKEMLTGTQTDYNNELSFTLKPGGSGGDTVLDITVVDDETGLPVGGIWVYVSYGGNVLQKINDENGYTSFNLGSYTGKVVVTTPETQVYKKAIRSLDLKSGTTNLVIHLLKEDGQIPWELIAIGVLVAAVAATAYYAVTQRRPRRRRRRRS